MSSARMLRGWKLNFQAESLNPLIPTYVCITPACARTGPQLPTDTDG
jgi:hypothetical protein